MKRSGEALIQLIKGYERGAQFGNTVKEVEMKMNPIGFHIEIYRLLFGRHYFEEWRMKNYLEEYL